MRSKDGDILTRWSELYHDDRGPPPIINNDEGPQILEEQVKETLGKAAGPDDILSKW